MELKDIKIGGRYLCHDIAFDDNDREYDDYFEVTVIGIDTTMELVDYDSDYKKGSIEPEFLEEIK